MMTGAGKQQLYFRIEYYNTKVKEEKTFFKRL